jgi:hypothetical protein
LLKPTNGGALLNGPLLGAGAEGGCFAVELPGWDWPGWLGQVETAGELVN